MTDPEMRQMVAVRKFMPPAAWGQRADAFESVCEGPKAVRALLPQGRINRPRIANGAVDEYASTKPFLSAIT
jgi:hypothetical protein